MLVCISLKVFSCSEAAEQSGTVGGILEDAGAQEQKLCHLGEH